MWSSYLSVGIHAFIYLCNVYCPIPVHLLFGKISIFSFCIAIIVFSKASAMQHSRHFHLQIPWWRKWYVDIVLSLVTGFISPFEKTPVKPLIIARFQIHTLSSFFLCKIHLVLPRIRRARYIAQNDNIILYAKSPDNQYILYFFES